MKLQLTFIIIVVLRSQLVDCFWPPPVDIDLKQEEVFELSDPVRDEEVQDVYDEDEMIQDKHRKALGIQPYSDQLSVFHRNLKREKELKKTPVETKQNQKLVEFNPDMEEPIPWKAGIVNQKGELSGDVYYFEEDLKEPRKRKREGGESTESNYDYVQMKSEYNKLAEEAARSKETLNYTEVKEDETPKEAIEMVVDFKKVPKNCTEQEKHGIGLQAIECLLADLSNPKMKNRTLEKIIRITIIWVSIYLVVATFCWCQYGWCCCCCRCKVCRPREQIDEAKKFFVENPLGVYKESEDTIHRYQPTYYEKYALNQLEKELGRL